MSVSVSIHTHTPHLYYFSLKALYCVVLCCVVQYRRPNGWTDRAQNLLKHSLGLCDDHRGVGELECARVRAVRAQTCVQHHISSIGGQTAWPIGLKMCTNTHLVYATTIGGLVNSSARACVLRARANVRTSPHIRHRRPNGWADRPPNLHKHSLGICDDYGGLVNSSARVCVLRARQRASSTTYPA
jgi:hypothetical protein